MFNSNTIVWTMIFLIGLIGMIFLTYHDYLIYVIGLILLIGLIGMKAVLENPVYPFPGSTTYAFIYNFLCRFFKSFLLNQASHHASAGLLKSSRCISVAVSSKLRQWK